MQREFCARRLGGELEASLAFFAAESAFYPDFDRLCRQRVEEQLDEQLDEQLGEVAEVEHEVEDGEAR